LFAASLLLVPKYTDPFHGCETMFETACAIMAEWRRFEHTNRSIAACLGMSFWKRRQIGDMFRSVVGRPVFCRTAAQAVRRAKAASGSIAVWASREPAGLAAAARAAKVPIVRVEDGFLRSVGLGADFIPAASIIADRGGVYYDPNTPSDFLKLAQNADFEAGLLDRASALIALLVERGITKYNTGTPFPKLELLPTVRRIFVPGQVEDDRSVLAAGCGVRGNLDLLRKVRAANPDAFIVYKPHPDVDAGHRIGAVPDHEVRAVADLLVRGASSADIIQNVDEVHSLTSLAGFEALLRRRRVVVYGKPFYAGWGLTEDMAGPIQGRGRKLSLEQLVAVTLILYPRYLDPLTRLACGPEIIIERLGQAELWRPGLLVLLRRRYGALMNRLRRTGASVRGVYATQQR
jgi:capsular polysaccharide export protein